MYTYNDFKNLFTNEHWFNIMDEILETTKDNKKEEDERKKIRGLIFDLVKEYNKDVKIKPSFNKLFKELNEFDLKKLSVVIIYFRNENIDLRERNILDEMYDEYRYLIKIQKHKFIDNYDFDKLKSQGVLTLNICMTYSENNPNFHIELWQLLMPKVISEINKRYKYIVYLLWDQKLNTISNEIKRQENDIGKKKTTDDKRKIISYLILQAESLPKGKYNKFKGCNHFIITNHFLKNWHKPMIEWI